ncbi:hypothetical protein V3C99_017687 [Haemonchus contortus]|nr:unnamed protein product [Haemonchus contortus]
MTEDKYNILAGYLETAFNSKTGGDSLSSLSSAVSYIYTTANSEHLIKVMEMMAATTNEMVQAVDRLNEATTGLFCRYGSSNSKVAEMVSHSETALVRTKQILGKWCVLKTEQGQIRLPEGAVKALVAMKTPEVINMFNADPSDESSNQLIVNKIIDHM